MPASRAFSGVGQDSLRSKPIPQASITIAPVSPSPKSHCRSRCRDGRGRCRASARAPPRHGRGTLPRGRRQAAAWVPAAAVLLTLLLLRLGWRATTGPLRWRRRRWACAKTAGVDTRRGWGARCARACAAHGPLLLLSLLRCAAGCRLFLRPWPSLLLVLLFGPSTDVPGHSALHI